jgi:hypothetical protein
MRHCRPEIIVFFLKSIVLLGIEVDIVLEVRFGENAVTVD